MKWPSWGFMLVSLPWVIGIVVCSISARSESTVADRQRATTGIYTAYDLANHNQCRYTFTIAGKSYTGESMLTTNSIPKLGDPATIFYDPNNPATNSLEDFTRQSYSNIGMISFMASGICTLAIAIWLSKAWLKVKAQRR